MRSFVHLMVLGLALCLVQPVMPQQVTRSGGGGGSTAPVTFVNPAVGQPDAPVLTNVGTTGSATCSYVIWANTASGRSYPSNPTTIANCPTTTSGLHITGTAPADTTGTITSYSYVLTATTVSGGVTGLISNVTPGDPFDDTTGTGDHTCCTLPSSDSSAGIHVAGGATFDSDINLNSFGLPGVAPVFADFTEPDPSQGRYNNHDSMGAVFMAGPNDGQGFAPNTLLVTNTGTDKRSVMVSRGDPTAGGSYPMMGDPCYFGGLVDVADDGDSNCHDGTSPVSDTIKYTNITNGTGNGSHRIFTFLPSDYGTGPLQNGAFTMSFNQTGYPGDGYTDGGFGYGWNTDSHNPCVPSNYYNQESRYLPGAALQFENYMEYWSNTCPGGQGTHYRTWVSVFVNSTSTMVNQVNADQFAIGSKGTTAYSVFAMDDSAAVQTLFAKSSQNVLEVRDTTGATVLTKIDHLGNIFDIAQKATTGLLPVCIGNDGKLVVVALVTSCNGTL